MVNYNAVSATHLYFQVYMKYILNTDLLTLLTLNLGLFNFLVNGFWIAICFSHQTLYNGINKAKVNFNTISHSAQMYGPGRRMTRRPVWLARSKKCSKSLSPVKLWTPCTASWKFQGTYLRGGRVNVVKPLQKGKDRTSPLTEYIYCMYVFSLHLDSIETSHVHLYKPVPPVVAWDSGVVDAARDVLKRLPIFQETVVFVVYRERSFSRDLQEIV